MGWRLIDRPKTQKVTHKLAEFFATMDPAPHDRPLSERRLEAYNKMLDAGGFRPVTWATAKCLETRGQYRVNGKHTSTMFHRLSVLPEFYVTIEEYECDTLDDVARLYATFDSKMMSRTARDIYLSFAHTVTELKTVPAATIVNAITGMAFHLNPASSGNQQAAEKAELLLEYSDFAIWLDNLFTWDWDNETAVKDQSRLQHLKRQPVVAAMFASWLKSKTAATTFWQEVRDETGTSPDVPSRKYARYLLSIRMKSGGIPGVVDTKRPLAQPREIYVKGLHTWNAWCADEPTDLKYYPSKDIPEAKAPKKSA